jgi:preprotein translocase subunit SecE
MTSADIAKLVVAALLVAAGIAGYYLLGDAALVLRILAVAAGIAAGAATAVFSAPGREFLAFARESLVEVKKVVWPTRKETLQTTGLVFLFILLMALFLWLVDATLLWLVKLIMGRD